LSVVEKVRLVEKAIQSGMSISYVARSFGLKVEPARWLTLCCVTGITAASVPNSSTIGWMGLFIPHFARTLVGPIMTDCYQLWCC